MGVEIPDSQRHLSLMPFHGWTGFPFNSEWEGGKRGSAAGTVNLLNLTSAYWSGVGKGRQQRCPRLPCAGGVSDRRPAIWKWAWFFLLLTWIPLFRSILGHGSCSLQQWQNRTSVSRAKPPGLLHQPFLLPFSTEEKLTGPLNSHQSCSAVQCHSGCLVSPLPPPPAGQHQLKALSFN